jgi:type IV secretion system protein VirD4
MNNRRLAVGAAVLCYVVAGFFAAEYLAGAFYFVANKTMPHGITLGTWANYWHWYSSDPTQHKRLQLAAVIAGVVVYVVPLLIAAKLADKGRSLHGDARFATSAEVRKAGLLADDGIIVGKYHGRYLIFKGQQFVLVAAPTRSGKGVSVVLPNLLNFNGSTVTLDVKLENFKYTSKFRAAHGHKVFLWAPFAEDGKTHRWNPLDTISRDRNRRVGDVMAISQALYPNDNPKDAFWNDQARNLFLGLCLYLLETPELPCTLGEVLRQSSGKGMPVKDYLLRIMAERSNGENALSDECLDALNRFVSTSENTMASILATLNAPLTIFAIPVVDAATSTSDFDIANVRKELTDIYVGVQPENLKTGSLLFNLFFSQLINLNTRELPQNNPALKHQCLCILDEFTAIGKVSILASAVSYIAGYNIRLLPIIQSISQLESVYGEKDTRTFVTNHALQILFPPREQKDANEYSEMLGYFTQKAVSTGISRPRTFGGNGSSSENVSDQKRALMLPQELKELDQAKEIIIVENSKPILCDKARYFSDQVFIDRLKALSPTLQAIGRKLPNKDQLEEAAFKKVELSARVPAIDIDLHKAKTEKRVRTVKPGEEIDLAKLAIDTDSLPQVDAENPSEAQVSALVDAFFSSVEWVDQSTGEISDAPSAEVVELGDPEDIPAAPAGGEIEFARPPVHEGAHAGGAPEETAPSEANEPPDDYFAEPTLVGRSLPQNTATGTTHSAGEIDLSVLDR